MKKLLFLLIFLILISGCSPVPMAGPQRINFCGHGIYQGQSSESIEKELGPPDIVSMGSYPKNSWAGGVWFVPGTRTIEWVYLDMENSLILWLDSGMVGRLCVVPTSKIRR